MLRKIPYPLVGFSKLWKIPGSRNSDGDENGGVGTAGLRAFRKRMIWFQQPHRRGVIYRVDFRSGRVVSCAFFVQVWIVSIEAI